MMPAIHRSSRSADAALAAPPRRGSIRSHLIVLVAVQAIIIAVLIGFAGMHDFANASHRARTAASAAANLGAGAIGDAIDSNMSELAAEAATPGYSAVYSHPESCTLTASPDDLLPSDLHIVRPNGTIACSSLRPSGGLAGAGYGTQSWWPRVAKRTDPFGIGPTFDPITHASAYILVAPIRGGGALVASARLEPIARGLEKCLSLGSPKPSFAVVAADRKHVLSQSDATGDRISAASIVPGLHWQVFAHVSTQDAFADARKSLRDRIVLGLLMIAIAFAAGLLIHRRIARPISSLVDATQRASAGDLEVRIEPSGPSEIAHLARGFNFMLGMRAKAEQILQAAFDTERDASDRLRELDTMKNSFLMAISHELRTPLTAVAGYASLLNMDIGTIPLDQAKEYTTRIEIASKRLQRLMLDLLDFERMTRGVVQANLQSTELRPLVDRVLLELDVDRPVKVEVRPGVRANVDAALLERVIENLVINATKHTKPGTQIWVKAQRKRGVIEIAVEDAGRGVPRKVRKSIFEPFVQGSVPSHSPGTGVGLALVSQFAKLHGGRAWVTDRVGGGASFRVTVPVDSAVSAADAEVLVPA